MLEWNFCNFDFSDDDFINKYKIFDDFLIIYSECKFSCDKSYLFPPFGTYSSENFKNLILNLLKTTDNNSLQFRFVPFGLIKYFMELSKTHEIIVTYDETETDYIYNMEEFKKCIKKKLIKKFVKKFKEKYKVKFETIDKNNKYICLDVNKKYWCDIKKCNGECLYCIKKFLEKLIKNFEFLGIEGALIKSETEDKYLSYEIVKKTKSYLTLFEMKSAHIPGLNYYILDEIINIFEDNINFINITNDAGILSLKNYKRSLCKKYELLNKYQIKITKKSSLSNRLL